MVQKSQRNKQRKRDQKKKVKERKKKEKEKPLFSPIIRATRTGILWRCFKQPGKAESSFREETDSIQ